MQMPVTLRRLKGKETAILLSCLILGFALRFYAFDQKSFWLDEIHTFNDSRDDLKGQIQFYRENPTFLHPPLFFVLTHQFYPFPKPERDLRIIPLIFGTLSIPMIYLLSRAFTPPIAFPCTLALTFMTYHISLSQDGRSYSLLMFFGMAALYFFMRHLQTSQKRYLLPVAFCFAILFHTSYSSIPFIALSQVLWFYRAKEATRKPSLSSFFFLNALTFLFCLPWLLFVAIHYKGQIIMDPLHTENPGSLSYIILSVFHDWVPHAPLTIISVMLLMVFPIVSRSRRNAFVLLGLFLLPSAGLYLFCKLFEVTHFITSRYLVNFLPLFFITLYLSLQTLELRFDRLKRFLRPTLLFTLLLIASNLVILPLYYHSEKQDFRGLATYLRSHLREGDRIFVGATGYFPGILHYLGYYPEGRHHMMRFWEYSDGFLEIQKPFVHRGKLFTIFYSKACCSQFAREGHRVWIAVGKSTAQQIKATSPAVLKGYFDGSFLNFDRFPTDASMYLFLWDPQSPREEGIDIPID